MIWIRKTETLQYRAIVNGEHTILHPDEYFTFRSTDPFSIRFESKSPFIPAGQTSFEAQPNSNQWIIPVRVRHEARPGHYPYMVQISKLGRTFRHEGEEIRVLEDDPGIIIEQL